MADHKRQHYVPRCYFKPFSLNGAGAAIHVFNIQRSRKIQNASIKGQCAKDYLYGEDLRLERLLQDFEGQYARILRVLQHPTSQPTDEDLNILRSFAYLQFSRTDMAVQRARAMHEGLTNAAFGGRKVSPPDLDLSDRALMRTSMRLYADMQEFVDDLKTCIVKNETDTDFVTSDDPSVFTSRYYLQRLRADNFGIVSSGALLFLPLTTHLLLMCYDANVYTVRKRNRHYSLVYSQKDVLAFNELQYLKAADNIYFARWDDSDRVVEEFEAISERRPDSWCNIRVMVPDGQGEKGERYRLATEEERKTAKETLVWMSSSHPAPSRWPSIIKYRDPVRTYSDGSAVGHVRKIAWLKSDRDHPNFSF